MTTFDAGLLAISFLFVAISQWMMGRIADRRMDTLSMRLDTHWEAIEKIVKTIVSHERRQSRPNDDA